MRVRRQIHRGFTLVEAIVAMAVLALTLGSCYEMFSMALTRGARLQRSQQQWDLLQREMEVLGVTWMPTVGRLARDIDGFEVITETQELVTTAEADSPNSEPASTTPSAEPAPYTHRVLAVTLTVSAPTAQGRPIMARKWVWAPKV